MNWHALWDAIEPLLAALGDDPSRFGGPRQHC